MSLPIENDIEFWRRRALRRLRRATTLAVFGEVRRRPVQRTWRSWWHPWCRGSPTEIRQRAELGGIGTWSRQRSRFWQTRRELKAGDDLAVGHGVRWLAIRQNDQHRLPVALFRGETAHVARCTSVGILLKGCPLAMSPTWTGDLGSMMSRRGDRRRLLDLGIKGGNGTVNAPGRGVAAQGCGQGL